MHIRIGTVALSGLLLGSLFFGLPAKAADWETLTFDSIRDNNVRIRMQGYFSNSKSVSSRGLVFSYSSQTKTGNYKNMQDIQYTFGGRTGEKTFELVQYKGNVLAGGRLKSEEKKISVYFDSGTPLPLPMEPYYGIESGCTLSDLPKLKMIRLAGNELEMQVLLPDCLKK